MGTQDIIEGSWTENKETKQIIARQDMKIIFEKIKTNIKETTKESARENQRSKTNHTQSNEIFIIPKY